ncbi:AarF/ABC1/UbiB kinase family protein [Erythrobacter arachoides]|uniref:AarF/ABC1/UbiB kinase family protein n=1 Tax=Aurantiacibacter arachoides TaxID=1850444 RepID=A0A845A524_9SPHN|nr:AarF/ABC1/UbiB kinase family protein [Aurantiacibacter arachoides]MXO92679.1 AarF/ABC1/UbiB kinase family protein [Aurantiacibacter arachoides]GGD55290.1 ubiquinol-cytochrome c reductase [Aurantiacibacter arachoides]
MSGDDRDDRGRDDRGRAVPHSRLARLGQFGRLAGGIAGGMVAEGARRLGQGERPRLRDMLLTPGNAMRLADRLSHLRGAAMKLGQMISMDAGDMLPPELAVIMARLRNDAHHMRPDQLQRVLAAEWGPGWRTRFSRFDPRPMAAASIGQVHRATTRDGRDLAIKVQYPGVRESIDADVDNVAILLRVSGLLPAGLDIAPLLAEAKQQLAEEADYEREGAQMTRFGALLADMPEVVVPVLDPALTTSRVLAMDFIEGRPIESLEDAPQAQRDSAARTIIALVLRELFEFGLMQTDPNFANYRYQQDSGRIVLLDFGAARSVGPEVAENYRRLLRSGLAGNRGAVRDAAVAAGFLGADAVARHAARIDAIIDIILREMNRDGPFDFGDRQFVGLLRDDGMAIAQDRAAWHVPPADVLFIQRKISGTALLAARLRAKVDVREMVLPWLA